MQNSNAFDQIKHTVESSVPLPIASIFRRYRLMEVRDLGGRHKLLIDLFEVLVKFICILALKEAQLNIDNLKDKLPQKEKTLEFLKRPSIGGWISLLRLLAKVGGESANCHWLSKISAWYTEPKNDANTDALSLFDQIGDVSFQKKSKTPNAEICNAMVTYRNKQFAHAANLAQDELRRRLPLLEGILAHLLASADFLLETHLYYTNRIEVIDGNQYRLHVAKLNGINEEPVTVVSSHKYELKDLYVALPGDGNAGVNLCQMSPFLLLRFNDNKKRREIFFYNDAWRTKLDYLSYLSGEHYYHKELHSGFEELISIKISPGKEEDPYIDLTPEERSERAEIYFKRAILLKSNGKFEDALETLEDSAEYERRPATFLEMADIEQQMGAPPEVVEQMLQQCLDLEPGNKAALAIRNQLGGETENQDVKDDSGELPEKQRFLTFFHLFTPSIFRQYAFIWWVVLFSFWYGLSALAEFAYGGLPATTPLFFQFSSCILLLTGVTVGRGILIRMKLPLSLQLDAMRLERFDKWFARKLWFIFGHYGHPDKKEAKSEIPLQERIYLVAGVFWTIAIGIAAVFLTGMYKEPFPIAAKRYIDYALIYAMTWVVARYIIGTTWFIFAFSQLSLKPMLTRINDDGMRSFGPLITLNLTLASLFLIVYWMLAAIVVKSNSHLDLLFLGLFTFFFSIWSFITPFMLCRAARESKSKAVHIYSDHIEKAFNAFLEDPNEDTENRYLYLIKTQKIITRIATWPLSVKETLFAVFGSNVMLIAVDVAYACFRLGFLPITIPI